MKYLLLPVLMVITLTSAGQKVKPTSTSEFIQDCMKNSGEIPNKSMVIWFPHNFWQIVGDMKKLSPDVVQNIVNEMSQYMMFAVVDYSASGSGITFKSEAEIRKTIKLYDSAKNAYTPVDPKEVTPAASVLLNNLQPMMAQMLGQFGEGMRIFLFKAQQVSGKPAIDITKPNTFSLSWDQVNVKWTLPFASILPPKFCPVDNEPMKGNWNYCPIHGAKLDK